MARRAIDGIQQLIDRIGGPKLTTKVIIDQQYAQDQHENFTYVHPRGGGPKYLEIPLFQGHPAWIQDFASTLLNQRKVGSNWHKVGQKLRRASSAASPVMFGNLRNSGAVETRSGSSVVAYDPPRVDRLTDEELEALNDTRVQR